MLSGATAAAPQATGFTRLNHSTQEQPGAASTCAELTCRGCARGNKGPGPQGRAAHPDIHGHAVHARRRQLPQRAREPARGRVAEHAVHVDLRAARARAQAAGVTAQH